MTDEKAKADWPWAIAVVGFFALLGWCAYLLYLLLAGMS